MSLTAYKQSAQLHTLHIWLNQNLWNSMEISPPPILNILNLARSIETHPSILEGCLTNINETFTKT